MQWSYKTRITGWSYSVFKEIAHFWEKQGYKMSDCSGKMDLLGNPSSSEADNRERP